MPLLAPFLVLADLLIVDHRFRDARLSRMSGLARPLPRTSLHVHLCVSISLRLADEVVLTTNVASWSPAVASRRGKAHKMRCEFNVFLNIASKSGSAFGFTGQGVGHHRIADLGLHEMVSAGHHDNVLTATFLVGHHVRLATARKRRGP